MKPQLDTNLVFIAESLYRTLNVSKTAKELNMSQSAVSHALARLRKHFDDMLFVRVSKGMAATATAKRLRPEIEAFVKQAWSLGQAQEKFDPRKANARISIATTDLIEAAIMPELLQKIRSEAPGIQISLRPTGSELPKEELENGTYDLAIAGFYKNLPEGFYITKLMEEGFSTAYRRGHPLGNKPLSLARYYEAEHALITLQGDFKDGLRKLDRGKDKVRNIVYGSYSFTGLAWILAKTDVLVTAPTILLERYKDYFPILIQDTPVAIPKIEIQMVWHQISHTDPVRMWFREVLRSEFKKLKT